MWPMYSLLKTSYSGSDKVVIFSWDIPTKGLVSELERQQVRQCKRRLEQATRQPGTSSHNLQRLLDDLKGHETALTNAQANLDVAKSKQRGSRQSRPTSYHQSRPAQPQT